MSSSSGEKSAGGGVSDMEDLEQRLAERMDTALQQRMEAMTRQLSSMMQSAMSGGGERGESGGGGSAATGGNQFVPGTQSGASGGAGMSSIPSHAPTAVGPEGSQEESLERSHEAGGVDSPRGEVAVGVGGGAGVSEAAAFSFWRSNCPAFSRPIQRETGGILAIPGRLPSHCQLS